MCASCVWPNRRIGDLPAKVEEAYRAAHRLACHEWSVRQFIGGAAPPAPRDARGVVCGGGRPGGAARGGGPEKFVGFKRGVWPPRKPAVQPATGWAGQAANREREK